MRKIAWVLLCIFTVILSVACSPTSKAPTGDKTTSGTVPEPTAEPVSTANPVGAPYNKPTKALTAETILEKFQAYTFQDETTGKQLPFRIYLPDGYNENGAYPLLLFLHGAGQRGNDNRQQVEYAVAGLFSDLNSPVYGSIVICPQCPADEQWVDTPWANGNYRLDNVPMSSALHCVSELVKFTKETYAVDPSRVYITGLSMGGFGTWDLCMREPDLFAAALPVCGGGSPENAELIARLPIVTVHGDSDTSVPVDGTRGMVAAMRAVGNDITYHELKGYKHNVWDWTFTNMEILNWLYSQSLPASK